MENARIGMDKKEIDTPALLIDLDKLEENIERMGEFYEGREGAAYRPHQKGHRLPIVAKKQLEAGACGVSMTSLGLAEFYVESGIEDILITTQIYGKNKLNRLCSLSKQGEITVSVDNLKNVEQLSRAACRNNAEISVAPQLYMGSGTAGVEPGKAKKFSIEVASRRDVNFEGFWWHQDLTHLSDWGERKEKHFETLDRVAELVDEIREEGMEVEMLSGGYTCTWNITPTYPSLENVEVQAGAYVFNDWVNRDEMEGLDEFECALTVLSRCISRPTKGEALFDSGLNSCSWEATNDYDCTPGPKFKELEGVETIRQREEVSMAEFEEEDLNREIEVGDTFELIPPHSDTTAKLHDRYYCVRDGKVEAIWPNYGRGLL